MTPISVFDSSLISVWIYPARRLVHHQMKAYCFGAEFRGALTRGVEAMEQYGATKWLSDDRANGALQPEDQAWGHEVFFPRARAAGWRYWATVQPAKLIGQVNLARSVKQYMEWGIDARTFTDPDEAMRWLDGL
jgi:hypothetical protein